MLDLRLSLFDYALDNLVSDHHIGHCKAHRCKHSLARIDVGLQLKAERQRLLQEIKSNFLVSSHVTQDRLESVGGVGHGGGWTARIYKHRNRVVPVLG